MDVFVPPVAGTVVPLEPLGLEGPSDPKGSLLGAVVVAVPSSSIPVEEEAGGDCPVRAGGPGRHIPGVVVTLGVRVTFVPAGGEHRHTDQREHCSNYD